MAVSSSHGALSRRPLTYNGRRVPNVYVRQDAHGRSRFEFQRKQSGRTTRVTLKAQTPTDAVAEANRLRVVSEESGIGSGSLRLQTLAERFIEEARSGSYVAPKGALSRSTLDLYEQRITSHVLPALGHSTRVRDVTPAHLRRLIDRLRLAGLSGSTIRGTIAATSAMFRFAVHREMLLTNPVLALDGDLPSGGRQTEPVYLSRDDLDRLLDALGDEFRPVAATCAFAGLRISETLGLTWADIDFANGEIAVARQLARDGRALAALKTDSSEGVVPMPEVLAVELRAHRERQGKLGFDRIASDRLVFVTRGGERSPGRRNALRAVQTQAEKLDLGNLGLHDLRHSTAGLLRQAGMPDEEIAEILRHSSARTTTAMYGGRPDEAKRAVRQKAAEALG
jgi:integrase